MARFGGFPDASGFDARMLVESTTESGSETVRALLPPGAEREALLVEVQEAMRSQAGEISSLVDELRGLVIGKELKQLINSVVIPATMVSINEGESLADGDVTASWAAKIEYLVGIALSVDPSGEADTPWEATERVRQLVSDIFEADSARMITEGLANANDDEVERATLLQRLKMEYQSDRMPGYAVHLQRVDDEVFGRHRDYYLNGLGFDPADVMRITRQHARWANGTFNSALAAMADLLNEEAIDPEAAGRNIRRGFDAPTLWEQDDVAARTGVPIEQVTAMLDFFSVKFGCQPDFRLPGDENLARTHPVIELGAGKHLVPDPWAMSAVLHHRLAVEPRRPGYDPSKYHKHRQDAHERLIVSALQSVFGAGNVRGSQHYSSSSRGDGEIDALVCAEWPLVVEGKAIGLTEAGRQGRPRRVDKKIEEILGKALDQTDRALNYILEEGARAFSSKAAGRPEDLLPAEISGGTAVIVTFERMDPLAFSGLEVVGSARRPTWVVALTDLLMVADILTTPGEFSHYARTRGSMPATKATAAAEADLLGAYLIDRLRIVNRSSSNEFDCVFIDYSCDELNDFYTRQEVDLAAEMPVSGVPAEVTDALAKTLTAPGWTSCVDVVMAEKPTTWKKWKRFRRRHRHGGTFTIGDLTSLTAVAVGEPSLECSDASITLNVLAHK